VKKRGHRERFREDMGIWPLFIQLERDGKPLTAPDDIVRHFIHVWAGDSIGYVEVVKCPWTVKVIIEVRQDSVLKLSEAVDVLKCLRTVSFGAQRSQGSGRCELAGVSDIVRVGEPIGKVAPMLSATVQ
jgi:hypothetical protein